MTFKKLLLKNTSPFDITNYLMGLSDGSNQFSTARIYPVSYNVITNEVHTSLEYGPVKEIHGLLLCTSSITRIVKGFQECNIALNGYNVDIVQVSQIVALRSPPCHSKSRMKEYYANIDIHLYKLAQLTGQLKGKHCVLDKSEKSIQSSRSPWEIRHQQGSRIKVDGVSTKSAAVTMVTAESGYLLQENVR